jgi:hypothetical protein
MKSLREFIFDDSSSLEEREDDDDSEMSMSVILNKKNHWPRLGSQVGLFYINRVMTLSNVPLRWNFKCRVL